MRFFFNAPDAEGGFVWFRDDAFNNCVEVTVGYGSERRIGTFQLPRRSSYRSALTENERVEYCRRAISEFCKRPGAIASLGHVDESTPLWEGDLTLTAYLKS